MLQRAMHGAEKLVGIERLHEESVSSGLLRHQFGSLVFLGSNKDHASLRRSRAQVGPELKASHWLHPDIENCEAHHVGAEICEENFRFAKSTYLHAIKFEHASNRTPDRCVVVNEANDVGTLAACRVHQSPRVEWTFRCWTLGMP